MSYPGYNMVEKGTAKPAKHRFSDAISLRTVYENLTTDDMADAERRSKIKKVFNGFLPYDRKIRERQGLKPITNVNFLGLRGFIEARATNILRLAQDTTPLVELQPIAKELAGPDAGQIADIIAEEFSFILRQDGRFIPALAMMNKEADLYGLGPVTWPTDTEFIPLALERAQLRFVGTGSVSSSDHDLFFFESTLPAGYLFYLLDNEEIATSLGWNILAVKDLVVKVFDNDYDTRNQPEGDSGTTPVEEALSKLRRMGTFETDQFKDIHVIHAFVREMEHPRGITHYMIPGRHVNNDMENPDRGDGTFLYQRDNAYENMDQCMLWFPYSVTERYAKEVRGIASFMLPIEDVKNRLKSAYCDAALRASSMVLTKKGAQVSDLSIIEAGPYTVIDEAYMPVPQQVAPKLKEVQEALKVLTDESISAATGMDQLPLVRDDRAYSPSTRQTKAMVQEQEDTRARHEEALFIQRMAVLDKVFQESYRRFMDLVIGKKRQLADNFPAVKTFVDRCSRRGVTKKVMKASVPYFMIRTCRDLIMGSEGKSGFLTDMINSVGGTLDEEGRRNVVRDLVNLRLGPKAADRYTPIQDRNQTPSDASSFAVQENNALRNGLPALVASGQIHWAHIPMHLKQAQEIGQEAMQNAEQLEDPAGMASAMEALIDHIKQHVEYGAMQIGMQDEAHAVGKALAELNEPLKMLRMQAGRQEDVIRARQEKADRERADLERRANENELEAAKYKADREAELARYREDKIHEARMAGIALRRAESEAKSAISAEKAAVDNGLKIGKAEAEAAVKSVQGSSAPSYLTGQAGLATPEAGANNSGIPPKTTGGVLDYAL